MNKIIKKSTLILFTLISVGLHAQEIRGTQGFDYNGTLITKNSSDPLDGVAGTPYYNETPELGFYMLDDGTKYTAYLKYNIYFDRMEFADNKSFAGAKELPKDDKILIQLGTDLFRYQEIATEDSVIKGYFEVLAMLDKKPAIIKKYKQYIQEQDQSRANSYGTRKQGKKLRDRESIYYIYDGMAIETDNHKRRSLESFPEEYQDQLKDFIKENKVKFYDDFQGLQELVKEYYRIRAENK